MRSPPPPFIDIAAVLILFRENININFNIHFKHHIPFIMTVTALPPPIVVVLLHLPPSSLVRTTFIIRQF